MRRLALLFPVVAGCAWSNAPLRPTAQPAPVGTCPDSQALQIYYYGSSGYVVRYRDNAFMTGGMVSNPGLLRTYFGRVEPDSGQIKRYFDNLDMRGMQMALIGHSHHDHLMDVPAIVRAYAPRTTIVGSRTTANLLAPVSELNVLAVGGDSVAAGTRPGIPLLFPERSPAFRVTTLSWAHAPNVEAYTFARGRESTPRETLPARARQWKMGDIFAYLVDVLRDDSTVAFRVHVSGAAAMRNQSTFPALADDGATRISVVTAGNFDWAPDYPRSVLLWMEPHVTVVGHWETFFARHEPRTIPSAIPGLKTTLLAHLLNSGAPLGSEWITPVPGATIKVCERRPD